MITRGFFGLRRPQPPRPLPPGQYYETGFPVLSAGPTPRISEDQWQLSIIKAGKTLASWDWQRFMALPQEKVHADIHCVTKWSKLDTNWQGVSVDTLLDALDVRPREGFIMVHAYGGYTTNLPLEDVTGEKAWIVWEFEGEPLEAKHGGPARLLVPHLYFWKSAKWVTALELRSANQPGFWEAAGYHMRGDPWQEERYWGD